MYLDLKPTLNKLPMVERGKLITAIYDFVETGEITEFDEIATDVTFTMVRQTLERDLLRYEAKCEQNTAISRNYWQKKKQSETECNRTVTERYANDILNNNENINDNGNINENINDTDIDNANVNVSENDNKNIKENPPSAAHSPDASAAKDGNDGNEKKSAEGADDSAGDPDPIIKYGTFKNLPMARSEYEAIKAEYGNAAERYIDNLSQNAVLYNKTYKDPAAVIRRWMERDGVKTVDQLAPRDKPMPPGYELLKKRALFV